MEVQDEVLDLLFDLTYKVTNFVRNNRHCKDGPRIKDVMLFKTIYKAENHQITDRKSTRLNSSHYQQSRMPSSA